MAGELSPEEKQRKHFQTGGGGGSSARWVLKGIKKKKISVHSWGMKAPPPLLAPPQEVVCIFCLAFTESVTRRRERRRKRRRHSSALRWVLCSFSSSPSSPWWRGGLGRRLRWVWRRVGSDLDVLGLHHLGERLLHSEDGEAGGGVMSPALWHQLQHGPEALRTQTRR